MEAVTFTETRKRQILLTELDDPLVLEIVSLLARPELQFHRAPWDERLPDFATRTSFDLIIAGHPVDGGTIERFLLSVRSAGSRYRRAGIILVSPESRLVEAHALLGKGVNRVVRADAVHSLLPQSVFELLQVASRFALHASARLSVSSKEKTVSGDFRTENVSATGMLVRGACSLPTGLVVDFEVSIPGDTTPIRGTGRVVRSADPIKERFRGGALRFLGFSFDDQSRFEGAVARAGRE
jgi:hypothetical protein